jgi:hypothetical protein
MLFSLGKVNVHEALAAALFKQSAHKTNYRKQANHNMTSPHTQLQLV